jgi:SMI1-KNR4 cell-wall
MRMVDVGPRVEPELLMELERERGVTLPADYRAFLAEYDGGRPEPCSFRVPSHEEEYFDVQVHFGLSRAVETSNVAWNSWQYRSGLGEGLLPIGCTDTNDLLLLGLVGNRRGRIMFWDAMASSRGEGIHEVAPGFRAFLDGLSDVDES